MINLTSSRWGGGSLASILQQPPVEEWPNNAPLGTVQIQPPLISSKGRGMSGWGTNSSPFGEYRGGLSSQETHGHSSLKLWWGKQRQGLARGSSVYRFLSPEANIKMNESYIKQYLLFYFTDE